MSHCPSRCYSTATAQLTACSVAVVKVNECYNFHYTATALIQRSSQLVLWLQSKSTSVTTSITQLHHRYSAAHSLYCGCSLSQRVLQLPLHSYITATAQLTACSVVAACVLQFSLHGLQHRYSAAHSLYCGRSLMCVTTSVIAPPQRSSQLVVWLEPNVCYNFSYSTTTEQLTACSVVTALMCCNFQYTATAPLQHSSQLVMWSRLNVLQLPVHSYSTTTAQLPACSVVTA